jgi:hypothetical protein
VEDALKRTADLHSLAHRLATTESVVALRIGEVTNVSIALVSAGRIRTRGERYPWPERDLLRGTVPAALPARVLFIRDERKRRAFMVG